MAYNLTFLAMYSGTYGIVDLAFSLYTQEIKNSAQFKVEQVLKVAKLMQIWLVLAEFAEKLAQKPLVFDLLEHASAKISGLGYLSVRGNIKKTSKNHI